MSKKQDQFDEIEDDYNDLYISEAKDSGPSSPVRGMGLDLSRVGERAEFMDDGPNIQEMPVLVGYVMLIRNDYINPISFRWSSIYLTVAKEKMRYSNKRATVNTQFNHTIDSLN